MLLGDIIERLEDEAVATEALLAAGDLALIARVQEAAAAREVTPGEFAADAVQTFTTQASDDDWVSLIGVMGQTTEPGTVCLRGMIEFALAPRPAASACGHHH